MEITEAKIALMHNREKLRAYANIVFDNCFIVKGLKVIEGKDRFYVYMPSIERTDGSHNDIAHPINNEMRLRIEQAVLSAYKDRVNEEFQQKMYSSIDEEENVEFGR